jgi:outer membrane usher protein
MSARTLRRSARLASVMLALLVLAFTSKEASGQDQTLLLEVVVNEYTTGKIGEFVLRDGLLYAKREELERVGLRVPQSMRTTTDGLVKISELPAVKVRLDQSSQTLHVTAQADRLMPDMLQAPGGPPKGKVESSWGATLNYDVIGTAIGNSSFTNLWPGQSVAGGQFDMRLFSPWGVLSSGLLGYLGPNPTGFGNYGAIRLDTTYTYSDPDDLMRYRAGDFITGGLPWTRPVRLGGAQVSRDFRLRPDLITFPMASVAGTVAVPSTVDVLVNDTRVLSRNVAPGPFQVPQLPVVQGAGTVTMAVTNALGQQVLTETPFYSSALLLQRGLDSFSAEAGLLRLNWGLVSNDYGSAGGVATYRRGITDWLTVEAHGEGTSNLGMGGLGLVVNVADLAVANFAAAGSSRAGQTGTQFTAGVQRLGRRWNLSAFASFASSGFADIAAVNGQPVPQFQLSASAGLALGPYGSVSVGYNVLNTPTAFVQTYSSLGQLSYLQPAQNTQLLTGTYTVQVLEKVSLYATGYNDFTGTAGSGVMVGLTMPLGSRSSASLSSSATSQDNTAQVQLMQTPIAIGDWGYRLFGGLSQVGGSHAFAEANYKSPWALLFAGVDQYGGQTTLQAGARGALSLIGGGLFASNPIPDSFAVVDTNGFKDVRVQQENREFGRTDSSGQLLVPDLRSFDLNHISIDPTDVPPDATVSYTQREVRPQDRSGVVVRFPIKTSRAALLQLTDEAGQPIPLGSIATLKSSGATAPVGYEGKVYLVDLEPRNEVTVERRNGQRCGVTFDYRPKPGDIPFIGPIRCREKAN